MKITIEIPRDCVEALLVAISRHAHEFGVSSQKERAQHKLAGKPFSPETKDMVDAWDKRAHVLNNVKEQVKKQARIK